jgi:mono/diheme cytochrome c family protein
MKTMPHLALRSPRLPAALLLLAVIAAPDARAAPPEATLSPGFRFSEQSGEALYTNVCQACHMGRGEGAVGAGRYPALVKDENLRTAGYSIYVVLHGYKAMPPFARLMSDDQVAAVVNYVRTHFGNAYTDAVTAEDVKNAR